MRVLRFIGVEIAALLGGLWSFLFTEIIAPALFLAVLFSPVILLAFIGWLFG